MVTFDSHALPKVLELYLEISQYPILAPTIRERMRRELFARGIISPGDLEREVKHKAVLSQQSEGLTDPFAQESSDIWQRRIAHFRDSLTDFYFAHNLPHSLEHLHCSRRGVPVDPRADCDERLHLLRMRKCKIYGDARSH